MHRSQLDEMLPYARRQTRQYDLPQGIDHVRGLLYGIEHRIKNCPEAEGVQRLNWSKRWHVEQKLQANLQYQKKMQDIRLQNTENVATVLILVWYEPKDFSVFPVSMRPEVLAVF